MTTPRFGNAIVPGPRKGQLSRHRSDVHDRTAIARLDHSACQRPVREHHARKIHVQHALPIFNGFVDEKSRGGILGSLLKLSADIVRIRNPRGSHGTVDSPEFAHRGIREPLDVVLRGHVDRHEKRALIRRGPHLVDDLRATLRIQVSHHDIGALLRETLHASAANAARAAGDDGYASFELHVPLPSLRR